MVAGAAASPKTGACEITFGGGFKVCQDGVTAGGCKTVARQMGGTPQFVAGGKCS